MDISSEIAAIQAASQGSELRQPLVGALNKLNSGSLPAVTASDAGKILKVGANGWEVGEKSGYMPVPTDIMQITDNGTYDVTNYASANVHISGGVSAVLVPKTITQNGTYDPADDNADGYSEVTVNIASSSDEILYNHNFELNTTGATSWDATNSGTSSSSRINIIDGWNIMQCTAEKVSSGLKIIPKKQYAYLTCQIPPYWFNGKTITLEATVNGVNYTQTGVFAASGSSINLNTPFGSIYCYGYSASDNVFTLTFINQIDQEFVISNASMKLDNS